MFAVITLGIYVPFWWYFINREMRDLGRARGATDLGDSPGVSVLAVTLGALVIVPAIISIVNTCKRIQSAQRLAGRTDLLNGWIVLVFYVIAFFIVIPFAIGYMQSELNKVWRTEGIADPVSPAIQPPAPQPAAPAPPTATQPSPADLPPPTGEPLATPPPTGGQTAPQPSEQAPQPQAPPPAQAPPIAPPPAPPQPATAPADWYPDPWSQARLRYWDGRTWTGHVAR